LGDDTNTNLHIDYGCERKFMMRALKPKPTLDRPATYQIQVPGEAVDIEQSGDGSSEQNDGKEVQNKA
jgi:hypothetical protein